MANKSVKGAENTLTLEQVSNKAHTHSTRLNGVKVKATLGHTTLVFSISCWISAMVIVDSLRRGGWTVEEI